MPPRKRVAEVEEYESDRGFVEDAPKSKKSRTTKKEDGSGSAAAGGASTGKDGEVFWEVSGLLMHTNEAGAILNGRLTDGTM